MAHGRTLAKATKAAGRRGSRRTRVASGSRGRSKPARSVDTSPNTTLGDLIETLGTDVLRIQAAPRGLDVVVTEPVIHDPLDRSHFEPGDVILAVGTGTRDRDASELINTAAASQAAAVVFKLREDSSVLESAANSAGIALIGLHPEMTWTQVHSLLKTAIASAGAVREGESSGTPVGDLFALANAVAAMVGGPVTIEDPQSRVMAFSSLDEPIDEPRRRTILGRRVPEAWIKRLHEHGVFRKLWSTEDVIRIELPYKGLRRRLAIAVRAGGVILGSIWVAEGRKPLGTAAIEALRESAKIAALHLIRHRTSEDLERRTRGELLRSLLEGRGPIEHMAPRLGIEANSPFTVMAFELQETPESEIALKRERVLELVALYCETFHRRAACVSIDTTIYALLPTPKVTERSRIAKLARRIIEQAGSSLNAELNAGIGSSVSLLRDVLRSRTEADQVLRVLMQNDRKLVAAIEEVKAETILLELKDIAGDRPHLRAGKIQSLVDHDSKHGTSYLATLRAYLDAFGDIAQAATSVQVHPNTFRYRIRRLMELSGIDLRDPNERLVTELQLRLL